MLKRLSLTFGITALAIFSLAGITSAHTAPPCNDYNEDGSPSGREYAQHHIVPMAKDGKLGNEGHKPGAHHGFNACHE
jgi:hypothetical protein